MRQWAANRLEDVRVWVGIVALAASGLAVWSFAARYGVVGLWLGWIPALWVGRRAFMLAHASALLVLPVVAAALLLFAVLYPEYLGGPFY